MGPISPMSEKGYKYILVVTDYTTRMLFTYALRDQTAVAVVGKLKKAVSHRRLP